MFYTKTETILHQNRQWFDVYDQIIFLWKFKNRCRFEVGKQNKLANWYKKVGSVGQDKRGKGMQEHLNFNAKISFISKLPKFWKQIKMKCSSLSFKRLCATISVINCSKFTVGEGDLQSLFHYGQLQGLTTEVLTQVLPVSFPYRLPVKWHARRLVRWCKLRNQTSYAQYVRTVTCESKIYALR